MISKIFTRQHPLLKNFRSFASSVSLKTEKNYYDILGISNVATENQIKDAYRQLAKKYHPDVRQGTGQAVGEHDPDIEKFREVVEAYNVLSVKESRAAFDISLKRNPQKYKESTAAQFE